MSLQSHGHTGGGASDVFDPRSVTILMAGENQTENKQGVNFSKKLEVYVSS